MKAIESLSSSFDAESILAGAIVGIVCALLFPWLWNTFGSQLSQLPPFVFLGVGLGLMCIVGGYFLWCWLRPAPASRSGARSQEVSRDVSVDEAGKLQLSSEGDGEANADPAFRDEKPTTTATSCVSPPPALAPAAVLPPVTASGPDPAPLPASVITPVPAAAPLPVIAPASEPAPGPFPVSLSLPKDLPTAKPAVDKPRLQEAPSDVDVNSAAIAGPGAAIRARLAAARKTSARTSAAKVEPEVLILYGSQTGNSMEIAKVINAEAVGRGIKSQVRTLNEFTVEKLSSVRVLIVVVSSTGDGDPPENAVRFCGDLRKRSHPATMLSGVRYTVVGLGDSNYTRYMAIPRLFTRRLPELGARCFTACIEADEVEGIDDKVEAWTADLWEPLKAALAEALSADARQAGSGAEQASATTIPSDKGDHIAGAGVANHALDGADTEVNLVGVPPLQPCSIHVEWIGGEPHFGADSVQVQVVDEAQNESGLAVGTGAQTHLVQVTDARCMTAEWSDRRVLHMEMDISGLGISYNPGDSIGIAPENDPTVVDSLINRLGLNGSARFEVTPGSADGPGRDGPVLPHVKCPCTVRDAFARYCDITAIPKKGLLRLLAECCSKPEEKRQLLLWSSRGGKEIFAKQVQEPRLSLLDLLQMHPSCSPPLAHLLDTLPPLTSRFYSVTSSQLMHPNHIQVAFSVVKMDLPGPGNRIFRGVCTNYFDRLLAHPGSTGMATDLSVSLLIFVKSGGDFHVPPDVSAPVIMIGPGTGVAPFRGFLEDRKAQLVGAINGQNENLGTVNREEEIPEKKGPWWLFFGCRKEEEDFLYQHELEAFEKDGTLDKLVLAFSRATDKKVYVQHRMEEYGEELAELILGRKNTHIFVCGDGVNMAKDVHAALCNILCKHGSMKEPMAIAHLSSMIKQKRYVRDIWS
ncbi:hypothetical protein CBR_g66801 [Chara braunii]|uniref:Methionine synthase reductase n=1 Tax=Chara braunii TaxID=69332 RepID=A0A388K9G3_CHABU|nr:hypothetical protein CBR_g66801 [Chara braunii]|eukprot:GBG66666.1 hypothetical protein CBR_g66801 [Chara braunii]